MKFNKRTHKVIIDTLNKEESQDFITFLEIERDRHMIDIRGAGLWLEKCKSNKTLVQLFESEMLRHCEDIDSIDRLIKKVKGTFGQAK